MLRTKESEPPRGLYWALQLVGSFSVRRWVVQATPSLVQGKLWGDTHRNRAQAPKRKGNNMATTVRLHGLGSPAWYKALLSPSWLLIGFS